MNRIPKTNQHEGAIIFLRYLFFAKKLEVNFVCHNHNHNRANLKLAMIQIKILTC